MSLVAGTRLGPYEVLAPIGAGGIGKVYKTLDTTLYPRAGGSTAGFRADRRRLGESSIRIPP
jgi:hypothetical protein